VETSAENSGNVTQPSRARALRRCGFALVIALAGALSFGVRAATGVSGAPQSGAPQRALRPRFVPGQILVRPKSSLSETNFSARLHRHGAAFRQTLAHSRVRVVDVSEENAEAMLAELRGDPQIEFAERDYVAEVAFAVNDPRVVSGNAWHLGRVQADRAWEVTAGRSDVVIAVLDSGVNAAHPDFAGRLLPGYDFVSNDSDPADDFGHGTAVTGTVAASGNNGLGGAGVAFGCRVLPVKVVDSSGFATYSCIAQGIHYAVDHGARVINLSIAGSSPSATLQDAIDYAWAHNAVIVAAAGNYASEAPEYPAACNHVLAVSATATDDSLASFSSFGADIALAAPGVSVWTTQRDLANAYGVWNGTSFSSPIVAGVAALVISENPSLSNAQIVSLLEQTADDIGTAGVDPAFGFGRVNAFRAVNAAAAAPGALPPSPPPPATSPAPPVSPGDTNAPAILITQSPKNAAHLDSPVIVLAGTADDDTGVSEVLVDLNGASVRANGTGNWNAALTLSPGINTVGISSVDVAGNRSPVVLRTFTYVFKAPLSVRLDGAGTIKPDLNGELLEVGKVYTVRAVPGAGQAFAGWTGLFDSSSTLSFTMQTNLTLTANFVPSPFPAVKGGYAGLFANASGVTPDNSGSFTLAVSASGFFTGKLLVGGNRHPFRGQLDLNGNARVTVSRGVRPPLTLNLRADLGGGSDQLAGTVSDPDWSSGLSGDRDVFDSRLNPAPQAGSRAFILAESDAGTAATGSSVIATGGSARIKGQLNDGRPFGASSLIGRNGDYPLYLSLKRGSEVVIGWLNFPATPTSAASGTVLWVRTGTNAFASALRATSAP